MLYDQIQRKGKSIESWESIFRGGSRDSVDGEGGGGLSYGAIFSIIDGTNCSPKAVLACRSVNLVFISFSVH